MLQWPIPVLIVAAVLAYLYRRGSVGSGSKVRVKPRTSWAVVLTTLAGEDALQPPMLHLRSIGVETRTETEFVGRSRVWKVLVRSGDLPRAREALARFEMHAAR